MIRRQIPIHLPDTVLQTVSSAASFVLCYRLIETTEWLTAEENKPMDTVYSLMVSKIECAVITDESYIYDVTRDEAAALALFEKIVQGGVTPCALFDVVSENLEADVPQKTQTNGQAKSSSGYLPLEKGVSAL